MFLGRDVEQGLRGVQREARGRNGKDFRELICRRHCPSQGRCEQHVRSYRCAVAGVAAVACELLIDSSALAVGRCP